MAEEGTRRRDRPYLTEQRYNVRAHLKTGMFLHVYCPRCASSLIEDQMVRFVAVKEDGQEGYLDLSPYFNVFDHRTDLDIPEGMELRDLKCPHCRHSIAHSEERCGDCGARAAELSVAAVQTRVPFFICMKKGCRWHWVDPEDEEKLIRDSSEEW